MRLEPGSRLGPYEVVGPIGAGGMGEVYRARDTRLGREVAVKVLPHELLRDRDRLARFEREARSASALNHRNIVTIHDFSSIDGEAWMVMELVRGQSLRSVLAEGPLPLKKLTAVATGIADGLAAAHAAGIIHRDLKPENIMIAADGTAKILDFGLVKGASAAMVSDSPTELQVSRTGMVMGTASYMSPEQARGEDLDFRSDQFSLGLILYEMATGRHPFARGTPVETLAAILNEEPRPIPDTIPEPLAWIIERCLERDREQRYGSTSDLAHDLRRLGDVPARAAVARHGRVRPLWWLAVVPLVLLPLLLWPRARTATLEPLHVDIATPQMASVLLDETGSPVSISPDGRHLLIAGVSTTGVPGIWIRDLRGGTTRLLAEKGSLPAWSQDGKGVAYYADGKLLTVPSTGGPPAAVCDARAEGSPAWHGDTIVFGQYSREPRGLYRVSARGGPPELLIPAEIAGARFAPPWWPHFVDDGRKLVYLRFAIGPDGRTFGHVMFIASADGTGQREIGRFASRPLVADDHLLYVRDGTLFAQPFDAAAGRLHGEARRLIDGLHYFRSTGMAAVSVSNNGILAWRSARRRARLAWLDRTGAVMDAFEPAHMLPDGRLSPDGTRYAVGMLDPKHGVGDIWVYDLARRSPERLTIDVFDEKAPVWMNDGRTLLHRSDGTGGPPDILKLAPGESRGQLFHRGPGVEEPHDVSGDGKWLLFIDYFSTGTDINLLSLDPGGEARPFVATPFNETSPRFSPDAQWVAYSSDVSGTSEIYIRSFSEPPVTSRVSTDGGTRPRWSRDGTELFFLGPDGRLMSAAMKAGVPAATRILFQDVDIVDFEPTPDGSRFIVQLQEGSNDTEVHLLINWQALLDAP